MGFSSPEYLCRRFLALLQEGDVESLQNLLQVPFALNRRIYQNTEESLAAIKKLIEKEDLKEFKVKDASSVGGAWRWNDFDKAFVEAHLKGRNWQHAYVDSGKLRLHFFVVNRSFEGLNDFKVASFRIGPSGEY